MKPKSLSLLFAFLLVAAFPAFSQKKVKDLPYHQLQQYSWMRLATIVPEVTDQIILPVGTVESHGACPIGTDNYIPENLAEHVWTDVNTLVAPSVSHGVTGASISQFPDLS